MATNVQYYNNSNNTVTSWMKGRPPPVAMPSYRKMSFGSPGLLNNVPTTPSANGSSVVTNDPAARSNRSNFNTPKNRIQMAHFNNSGNAAANAANRAVATSRRAAAIGPNYTRVANFGRPMSPRNRVPGPRYFNNSGNAAANNAAEASRRAGITRAMMPNYERVTNFGKPMAPKNKKRGGRKTRRKGANAKN